MSQTKLSQALMAFQNNELQINTEAVSQFKVTVNKINYEIDIASDLETRKQAYQLMYGIYSSPEVGYIPKDNSKMWYTLFNADAKTITLVIRESQAKKVVATLTIVFDSKLGLPLEGIYPNEVSELRKKNKFCAEIVALGFDESIRGFNELLIHLFKFAYLIYRGIYGATDLLIKIKPRHAIFYEKKLLFKKLGNEVNSEKINNKNCILFGIDLVNAQNEVELVLKSNMPYVKENKNIYKTFLMNQQDVVLMSELRKKVENSEMSISEMEYFFIQQRNLFLNSSFDQLSLIANSYSNQEKRKFIINYALMNFKNSIAV